MSSSVGSSSASGSSSMGGVQRTGANTGTPCEHDSQQRGSPRALVPSHTPSDHCPPTPPSNKPRPIGPGRLLHHQQQRQAAGLVTMYMHNICSHCTGHKRTQFTTPPGGRLLQRGKDPATIHHFTGVPPQCTGCQPPRARERVVGGRYVARL